MPEITVHDDFVVDPNYDEEKGVEHSIELLHQELGKQAACIDAITDSTMQLICMFSLIDCLAQEWAGYPIRDSRKAFCDFVLAHQKTCDYLDNVA